ncbi:MAG: class I SAM-dependent methyltransferase [Deltaproteobacteria bacterium]|nr:class I SAM-dependent methyltransferase [Deltaproteobacteria bacterium]
MVDILVDYSLLTEIPGSKASNEQLRRMLTRYYFGSQLCEGKSVLEVACGAGQGLNYLGREARFVIGGDYDCSLLNIARSQYGKKIPLCRLDGHFLPFRDGVFDVVILFEAIYYLHEPDKFISECKRILKFNGEVLICLPNSSLPDFHPSPYSYSYFTPPEISKLFEKYEFDVACFGSTPVDTSTAKGKVLSLIKKMVVKFNLMPRTLKGREFLKRLVFGSLVSIPGDVSDIPISHDTPVPISCFENNYSYRVIFALAKSR